MSGEYDPILYALVHNGTPGDLAFYRQACQGADRVLELGCGYGRVLVELAEAGHEVVGIDLDDGLLELTSDALADLNEEARLRARVLRGDMRRPPVQGPFDRILIPHSGLYCLLSDDDVRACLRSARALLAPGGKLVLDAYAADGFHQECEPEDMADDQLEEVALIAAHGQVYDVYERSRWDKANQTMVATYVHKPQDASPPVEASIEQRYLLRAQLEAHLEQAGFTVDSFVGDFAGAAYDQDSELWAVVASAAS